MRPLNHFVVSLVGAIVFYIFTRYLTGSLLLFAAGFFIDLDHLIDYWALKPKKPFSLREFLDSESYGEQKKYVFIFLHGYEWLILLWLAVFLTGSNLPLLALATGVSLHFLLDIHNIISEKIRPGEYFFTLRLIRGFKKQALRV